MRKLVYLLSPLILLFFCINSFAQDGRFDVRLIVQGVDCPNNKVFIDIEVKASASDSTFQMGDQNYKFTYNRNAITNPIVNQELGFSFSLFQPYFNHTTTGSNDPGAGPVGLAVLNVVWVSGFPGIPVDTNWMPVSRLEFDIIDPTLTECLNLEWRDKASNPLHFTNVTETNPGNSTTTPVDEDEYDGSSDCLTVLCPTLPVEWLSFEATRVDEDAHLNWSVASEHNNDHYDVLRSTDGVNYEVIGEVLGAGNSDQPLSYDFTDKGISSVGAQILYYQIRQVDIDGSFSFSNEAEIVLDHSLEIGLSVFPNPTADYVYIDYVTNGASDVTVEILNVKGQQLYTHNSQDPVGKVKVNAKDYDAGVYLVRVFNETGVQTTRFVVR